MVQEKGIHQKIDKLITSQKAKVNLNYQKKEY